MKDFDDLARAWKAQEVPRDLRLMPVRSLVTPVKTRLQGQALWSSVGLAVLGTSFFLVQWWGLLPLQSLYTQIALWALPLTLMTQAGLNLLSWFRLRRIDELSEPTQYLHHWRHYYQGRLKTLRWAGPVYFLSINLCFLLFLPQVLATYPTLVYKAGFVGLYMLAMALVWLKFGKHWLKKEKRSLAEIMLRLEKVNSQWQEDDRC